MSARDASSPELPAPPQASRSWRKDFPILERSINGHPLVYLDNAATTQKPACVIDAIRSHYAEECANVHRGIHSLSATATIRFEDVRRRIHRFISCESADEIVFTSGTTGAINLVAHSFGERFVHAGDEVLISEMEHHSNIVPWQLLCQRRGARLVVAPMNDDGALIFEELEKRLGPKTRIVAVNHTSNALGTRNPIRRIVESAHAVGARVLVDGAQAMAHQRVDVRELGCDFFAFSGHKMYGPTGIGVLYGRLDLLNELPPFLGGGEMIESVRFSGTTFKPAPARFEAGTPHIAGVIGLGAAVDYLERADLTAIGRHEDALLAYATERLLAVPGLRLIGTAPEKSGILSFIVDGIHAHDVGQWLDGDGVAVRAGHHCAQPVMEHYGVPSTVRASLACYNNREDIDRLVRALEHTIEVMS